jgi:hypothetical protein
MHISLGDEIQSLAQANFIGGIPTKPRKNSSVPKHMQHAYRNNGFSLKS